jgi:hypothetical protein
MNVKKLAESKLAKQAEVLGEIVPQHHFAHNKSYMT